MRDSDITTAGITADNGPHVEDHHVHRESSVGLDFPPPTIDPVVRPFLHFLHTETAGGFALFFSSLVALLMANSVLAESYARIWETNFRVGLESFELSYPLWYWINNALMAIFFFVVGPGLLS